MLSLYNGPSPPKISDNLGFEEGKWYVIKNINFEFKKDTLLRFHCINSFNAEIRVVIHHNYYYEQRYKTDKIFDMIIPVNKKINWLFTAGLVSDKYQRLLVKITDNKFGRYIQKNSYQLRLLVLLHVCLESWLTDREIQTEGAKILSNLPEHTIFFLFQLHSTHPLTRNE